ncbi:hypothetical protein [Alkaliphilus pronyensis]|nr:hypothetical protein [Alkaliphilus pronyensis]
MKIFRNIITKLGMKMGEVYVDKANIELTVAERKLMNGDIPIRKM